MRVSCVLASMAMSSAVGDGDGAFTAAEFITRSTLREMEAAILASKCCTYDLTAPELKALGADGITQSVFACKTCAQASGAPVGVCEPCVLRCHGDHDVVELGEKRQFQCDCPTSRSSVPCCAQAPPPLGEVAPPQPLGACSGNAYGHNFAGRFCTCDRGYDAAHDTMHQCFACDDWYHDYHIVGKLSASLMSSVGTFVCARCVAALPFLAAYARFDPAVCSSVSSGGGGGSGGDGGGPGGPPPPLQPWVCCLTCTDGADDGRGVCMGCAAVCHAGHVLTAARITEFQCDCTELGGCKMGREAPLPVVTTPGKAATVVVTPTPSPADATAAATPATPTAAAVPAWCAGARSLPRGGDAGAAVVASPSECAAAPPGLSAAVTATTAATSTATAAVYLEDDVALVARLCRCDACMRTYAAAGVATWFYDELVEDDSHSVVDTETAAAVPALLQRMEDGRAAAEGAGAGATAGGGGGGGGGGGHRGGGGGQPPPPTQSSSTGAGALPAAGAGPGPADALASRVGEALTQLQQAGFRTTYEQGMDALSTLPHARQLDALHAYTQLQSEIMPWLREMAEAGRVVTEADIRDYFANLTNGRRVRQRVNGGDS